MDDMISRAAALDALNGLTDIFLNNLPPTIYKADAVEAVKALPSAQPETAKRIVGKSRGGMTLWYQCDMCNEPVDEQDNYCRGCGRRLIDE